MLEQGLIRDFIGGAWRDLPFAPFHPGVTRHILYGEPEGAAAALLRYEAGARVPRHEHTGFEHILVLDGAQCDENGHYPAGTFAINAPGTVHQVWSDEGCVALLIWERPVRILI
ncbi:cupin domain-containing protein [Terrihabitans rhizophilus]|uniref:Cupin domain-containing protein n=1 Tax=Terrihabitans rhizophilus TaxID=3092662 RepID=A0ABU4RIP8_9HYPH|nr:cupin domain-containing protein [Terrihabitans sp. PJ23]MDX6804709.1 cupin domain-containing protein [Terrihabitans sp. PJ23]